VDSGLPLHRAANQRDDFFFPFHGFTPAPGVAVISMIALAAVIMAHYVFHMAGFWSLGLFRGVMTARCFNTFVLVV
jgi:hypothetical protein